MISRIIILEIICFLLILLFVYAAVSKIIDFQKFTVQIGQSPLLTGFGDWLPQLVIGAELSVSVMVAVQRWRLFGLFGAFSLMTMFTAYIIAILHFSNFIPCSCGGILEKFGWIEHLYFNGAFVVLGLIGIVLQSRLPVGARKQQQPK